MKLNIIFDTQSIGVRVFWSLFQALQDDPEIDLAKTGFFVTNKDVFDRFTDECKDFQTTAAPLLSEWEILEEARALDKPDLDFISEWEARIGDASLWNAIICDRRFNYPTTAQFIQNYTAAYDHQFLLKVLQVSLRRIDQHFEQVEPHLVVGLNAVTLYDYLYYLMAKARGIPYFQLKLTRVRNYSSFYTEPLGISPHIGNRIDDYLRYPDQLRNKPELLKEASEFIAQSRDNSLSYEGAISKTKAKPAKPKPTSEVGAAKASQGGFVARVLRVLSGKHQDPHYPSAKQVIWYTRVIKPVRRALTEKRFFTISNADWKKHLNGSPYALYPLNTEPEVALLVYGRSYRNQIETVRNIASNLPLGWKLVVKEHPNAKGYRSAGFYNSLRQIPNVVLVGPAVSTNDLVLHAAMVFVVFGTIGLEAVLKEKPVITFCETPYGSFPRHMVRFVDSMDHLGATIRDLLRNYRYEEWALTSYIAAHIEGSIPLNLFTGLLGKGGRESSQLGQSLQEQYKQLARYLIERMREEQQTTTIENKDIHAAN